MCGRFTSTAPADTLAHYFDATVAEQLQPSYNVAPTNDIYVVVEDGERRRLDAFRWGLRPIWAKDIKQGARMINARAEALAASNADKRAFARRRALVPASPGFLEWKHLPGGKRKQPMFIHRRDGDPLAFAGLWETWRGPDRQGDPLNTCTIITTAANETMAPIHDRMPVILPPSAWDQWLDPTNTDTVTLAELPVPAPASLLTTYPVATTVNNVRNTAPTSSSRRPATSSSNEHRGEAQPWGVADPDVPRVLGPVREVDDALDGWLCDDCGTLFDLDPQGFIRPRPEP